MLTSVALIPTWAVAARYTGSEGVLFWVSATGAQRKIPLYSLMQNHVAAVGVTTHHSYIIHLARRNQSVYTNSEAHWHISYSRWLRSALHCAAIGVKMFQMSTSTALWFRTMRPLFSLGRCTQNIWCESHSKCDPKQLTFDVT